MELSDEEKDLVVLATQNILDVLFTISSAKFGKNRKAIFFSQNVLANIMGNFIVEMSNPNIENSVEKNFQGFVGSLQEWKKLFIENKFKKDTH